ncbi:MAG TPA: hypothetical protein VLC93_13205, partial [Myxococcota bacterium]|nr:hypothetical protein [Myxococcota bacterium]
RINEAAPEDIQRVFNAVRDSNVAGLHRLSTYDPKSEFGLCYGRAFSGYVEALRHGISRDAIRKVWVVGRPNGPVTPGATVRHFLREDRADVVFFRDLLAELRRRAGRQ